MCKVAPWSQGVDPDFFIQEFVGIIDEEPYFICTSVDPNGPTVAATVDEISALT